MEERINNINYEFGLFLSEKDKNVIHLFNSAVPSIDDGINGTFPEKIRRFNNSATFLVNSILNIESANINGISLYQLCQDKPSDIDSMYRQLIRNVYMELFIYQEKLINIVCNLFFIRISKSRSRNLKELKARAVYFPKLEIFCRECNKLSTKKRFKEVMSIRNDEIHNMSKIDSFIYDLENADPGYSIINKGYKIKAETLRDDYIYVMQSLAHIRDLVQEILDNEDFWHIRKMLVEHDQEVWVN